MLQYFKRATPNSLMGVDIFNPSVNRALDAIDSMLEQRIAFTLPVTYSQAMQMKGLSEQYLSVLAKMTKEERQSGHPMFHKQSFGPVELGIIAGTIIIVGGMYAYVYVRSMELGYCVDHKCKADAEAECEKDPDSSKCKASAASDCHVILKPGEKC